MVNFYNTDNIRFMKTKADNFYDLAIVDPPYGINSAKRKSYFSKNTKLYSVKEWDNEIPPPEYFEQLFRVSKNQIIWGGNYFIEYLHSTKCWIIWDKMNGTNEMPDCEIAWTSFNSKMEIFSMHHFSKDIEIKRIHQTQKPVKLYRWLLAKYAKEGFKILDTHGGSFTHAIAANIEGYYLDIMDKDLEYYNDGVKQYKDFNKQKRLF